MRSQGRERQSGTADFWDGVEQPCATSLHFLKLYVDPTRSPDHFCIFSSHNPFVGFFLIYSALGVLRRIGSDFTQRGGDTWVQGMCYSLKNSLFPPSQQLFFNQTVDGV